MRRWHLRLDKGEADTLEKSFLGRENGGSRGRSLPIVFEEEQGDQNDCKQPEGVGERKRGGEMGALGGF